MITLYHSPFTRSHLIRFVLEELALPYELHYVNVPAGEHRGAAYLALNPLGQLPVLVDGGLILREAAAIALHLADKVQARGLTPELGSPARAPYYQWVIFSVASELLALSKVAQHTLVLPEPQRLAPVAAQGRVDWEDVARALRKAIQGRDFLLGETFSIADAMVGGSLWLADFLGLLAPHPELVAYFGRISQRPAFGRAFADAVPS